MLTEDQIAHFRAQLEAKQAHVTERLAETVAELAGEDFDTADDWADSGSQVEHDEKLMTERDSLQAELERIAHALARMAEGTYGLSEVSGEPIPLERLEALPTATTLVGEKKPLEW